MGSQILSPNGMLRSFLEEGDPDSRYNDLEQVGHGNFGAVYCAQDVCFGETVAIKKILIDKKDAETRLQDIHTELRVLTSLKQDNIVQIKRTYWKANQIWIVMEYCLGSLVDMLTTLSAPFSEPSISYISKSILLALRYIHSFNWIHRDVKAANVLISCNEVIKLGDFGSTSLKSPTNTFTGSPYWMAPEVILAMEDGEYCTLCDVWSLGITCIEVAEMKPPRFEKNAMSALYFIAQSESPKLSKPDNWSQLFNEFIRLCLLKNVEERPDCQKLLENEFLDKSEEGRLEFSSVINKCFCEAEAVNDKNYRKLKSFVENIDSEGTSTGSETQTHSTESGRPAPVTRMATLGQNVNTFKTTSTIVHESLLRENDFFQLHLNEYRQHRKNLNKQLTAFIQKLKNVRMELTRAHEKSYECRCQAIERQIEKMKAKMYSDMEQLLKSQVHDEKKLSKALNMTQKKYSAVRSPSVKVSSTKDSLNYTELFSLRAKQGFNRSLLLHQSMVDMIKYEKEERVKLLNERKNDYFEELQMLKDHNTQIDALKMDHMNGIHSIEIAGFAAYLKKSELQMNKKHLNELRMKPKELKACENLFKKKHCDKIRDARTQYKRKVLEKQVLLPKDEFIKAKGLLKRERAVMLTKLQDELTETLAKEMAEIELCYEASQQKEIAEMKAKSDVEYEQLQSYQKLVRQSLVAKMSNQRDNFAKDTKALLDAHMTSYDSELAEIERTAEQKLKQIDLDQMNSSVKYERWLSDKKSLDSVSPVSAQSVLNEFLKSVKENKPWSFM